MAKTTKPAPPQPTAPANKSTEIITFNVGQAAIEQSRAHAATLTINGPEDKEGNAAVYKYRQVVRQQRILIEKQQAELKRPQIKFNRAVDLAAKSLIEPLEQIEEHLLKMETEYRKERERIADEAARNLRIRTDARVKQLQGLGMVYNPVNDCYELTVVAYFDGGAIPAGQSTVLFDDTKRLTDEEFMPIVDNVETYFKENREVYDQIQAETDRVAAEKLAQDEADRKELAELRAAKKRQKDEARKVQLAELIKHAEAEPAPPELADRDKAIKQEFDQLCKNEDSQENERLKRLEPDKVILRMWVPLSFEPVHIGGLTEPESKAFLSRINEVVEEISREFASQIERL